MEPSHDAHVAGPAAPNRLQHPIEQFRRILEARGIIPPDSIEADGKLHRCDAQGRHGKGDAAYVLHLDGIPAGGLQNHRDGLGWENWRADVRRHLSPAELAGDRARVDAARRRRREDYKRRQAAASLHAAKLTRTKIAPADHPYLLTKGVKPHGLRLHGESLVVPICDVYGEIRSIQTISPRGEKCFLPGGQVKGCCHQIGEMGPTIVVCEGFATGATIFEVTNLPVVVAFFAGNLAAVAAALKHKFLSASILIAGDDDHCTVNNPGRTAAEQAALAVGGKVVLPLFPAPRPPAASDFNDLCSLAGPDAVRAAFDAVLEGA